MQSSEPGERATNEDVAAPRTNGSGATTMIGQYEVRELLGEGGIGQVHAGFDTTLEREIAIKSLRPELLNDRNFFDRFRGEATSLARLNHPNITTLYSLLPEGRNLYMVMELVRGETLDEVLKKRGGALGARESLAIIAQAADGLSYAHSMGVIHRDIKPANLMITSSGLVKIMDFGIARVRGSQRLTRDGSMVGTLAYMAPEQLRGEPGDERSDLYSLAIVLYELLTGAPPFAADSDYDLMQAHMHAKPMRLLGRVPGIDARVDAALMRALAKKPEQRFSSVREFCDALGATALRIDASKIVYEGTRLMTRPAAEQLALPSETGGSFERLSGFVERMSPLFDRLRVPAQLRVPVTVGIVTFAVAGVLAVGILALMPSPIPQAPGQQATASAPAFKAAAAPEAAPVPRPAAPPASILSPPAGTSPASAPAVQEIKPDPATNFSANRATVPGPTAKADFTAALERKDYDAAFTVGQPLAESGDRDAQFGLAWLYDKGFGVDRNEERAAAWYQKAAEKGHLLAQLNVGDLYEAGAGVPQSYEQALKWYKRAAEQGNPEAQYFVGFYYDKGQGTQQDDTAAVLWYEKSAQQGFAKAQKKLGDMYATGRGVGRNEREALRFYYQAAEQNHPDAEFNVGYWYENGLGGVRRDYQAAAQWYARAAEHGSAKAREQLDNLRSKGRIKG
ncbi:MAG TPA: serine/threonine-protein kinase [Xanthobacteraceae bacterium]|nr:serine/threonine-protein kinase [Xanthobacteraceae bacterium]